jgi:hypothetical protein
MQICVFVGPTVSHDEGRRILEATYLPPAAQGDVYEAARAGTKAVAIIDGYFERVPAVWHREILWAMSRGVHVFGSASMGALRAAELHTFGMVGVGQIFEAYRRGELEDDDEVAIVHGDAESGYRAASEAMVNIRVTVAAAVAESIVSPSAAVSVLAAAKSLFYPNRHYSTILRLALEGGVPPDEVNRLTAWLPRGAVNQKRADALAMLRSLDQFRATAPRPKVVTYHFQHTDAWEQVRRQIERRPLDTLPGLATPQPDVVLDELRLRRTMYADVWQAALTRSLALRVARAEGDRLSAPMLQNAIETVRRRHRLLTESEVDRWVAAQGWAREDLQHVIEENALAVRVVKIHEADLDRYLADELRLRGSYIGLAERAREKHDLLTQHGLEYPSCAALAIAEPDLWRWFFEALGVPLMSAPEGIASMLGVSSVDALKRLALREFAFVRLQATGATPVRGETGADGG